MFWSFMCVQRSTGRVTDLVSALERVLFPSIHPNRCLFIPWELDILSPSYELTNHPAQPPSIFLPEESIHHNYQQYVFYLSTTANLNLFKANSHLEQSQAFMFQRAFAFRLTSSTAGTQSCSGLVSNGPPVDGHR